MDLNTPSHYVTHPEEVWVPGCKVSTEADGSQKFSTEFGEVRVDTKGKQPEPITDQSELSGVDDICTLSQVSEGSLLHSVRVRYKRSDVYTFISRILVAVNPFKPLEIYSNETVEKYHSTKDATSLPPHIFGVGADAYTGLAQSQISQAVLIAGESGAGKTESTKLVLLYFSEVLKSSDEGLEDKVLQINPVLEAFGNAKTVRNNNSSRFGKWIEVQLNPVAMKLSGARITDYLLELPRVTSQGPGERNYHVFYQLCAAAQAAVGTSFDALKLGKPECFAYLNKNPSESQELNDGEGFYELRKAFVSLKFAPEEQLALFRIVAGILHLGNIHFSPSPKDDAVAEISSPDPLTSAAEVFGCSEEQLSRCMCFRRLVVGREMTESPQNCLKAQQSRDSVAKLIYGRLFKWLVSRCNEALGAHALGESLAELRKTCGGAELPAPSPDKAKATNPFLGVLDIAGFEIFETNMLEQLLINLSNEKLQQFFNNTVFKSELADYEAEGVSLGKVDFVDNADVLALIEGRSGLLSMLDDATNGVKPSDDVYTQQVIKAYEKHPRFVKPKFPNKPFFGVRHYAGEVTYTTTGFLDKNISTQPVEVIELMQNSNLSLLSELAIEFGGKVGGTGASRKATVGAQFKKSLAQLVEKLNEAEAHFIRCIKPNMEKIPDQFDSPMVMNQLQLSGVMEAVTIRKMGFPVRMKFIDFVRRYFIIVPTNVKKDILQDNDVVTASVLQHSEASKMMAARFMEKIAQFDITASPEEYAIGKTKLFLKAGLHATLEQKRNAAFDKPVTKIQAVFRGYRAKRIAEEVREADNDLKMCLEHMGARCNATLATTSIMSKLHRATAMEGSLDQLIMLIARSKECSFPPPHLKQAMIARARIEAEAELARKMQNATKSADVTGIEALLARSVEFNMQGEIVETLRTRVDTLWVQTSHRQALQQNALQSLQALIININAAKTVGLDAEDAWLLEKGFTYFTEAVQRKEKLEQEQHEREVRAAVAVQCRWRIKQAHKAARAAKELREKLEKERLEQERLDAERRSAEEASRLARDQEEAAEREQLEKERQNVAEAERQAQLQREKDEAERQKALAEEEKAKQKVLELERKKQEQEAEVAHRAQLLSEIKSAAKRREEEAAANAEWEKKVEECFDKMKSAAEEFDAKELKEAIDMAVGLGVAESEYSTEYKLFMDLQSSEFVENKLAELSAKAGDDMCDLLILSNLTEQLEELGLKPKTLSEEIRQMAERLLKKGNTDGVRKSHARSVCMSTGAADSARGQKEAKVIQKFFDDLTYFSKLRDPQTWGGRAVRRAATSDGVPPMLKFSSEAISEPLTMVTTKMEVASVRMFGNILRCMGDKPNAYIGDKEKPILESAKRSVEMCDEIYVQVMKQLTSNPSVDSQEKGWSLMQALCATALPSDELREFVRAFLRRHQIAQVPSSDDYYQDEPMSSRSASKQPTSTGSSKTRFSFSSVDSDEDEDDWAAWAEDRNEFLRILPELASEAMENFLESIAEEKRKYAGYEDME